MSGVSIQNVEKSFGDVRVIHGINVEIEGGAFVVLVGPSGCGKSTLLRLIAGLEDVTGGSIRIGGQEVNDMDPKDRDIAMVFQNYGLYPHMTVAQNMGFALKLARVDKAEIASRVNDAAGILNLDVLLDRYDRFVFLGSGAQHPLTQEAGLKIQEMAVATSEAYFSLDYRHGPKACANAETMVTLFTFSDRAQGLALARDVRALGAGLIVIGPDAAAYGEHANCTIVPVGMPDAEAAAAAMMVPIQLFAYHTALRRCVDPDLPVNLSRVVVL